MSKARKDYKNKRQKAKAKRSAHRIDGSHSYYPKYKK